ncbi:nitrate reductase [Paralcaligenes ureilyticus]|uniref:Assimilatory nitrate reductase (NADH) alpha subunit apoprotein n=1 Tax=Paralcaligenes ureilyticus TaxID=627131 RepID=A0A4R3LUD6_9BURK|nr:nitrate reductase [Paralcaligenes ureilyticus]TCT04071.1 assimilatory nitrate reductase (NADH) alpha subunit apoprotein [Paralcaligenes ureilyticus]
MNDTSVPEPAASSRAVLSVCCYCGTGCGVQIRSQGNRVVEVTGDREHPSSHGKLCSKGMNLAATVKADGSRILSAQLRRHKNEPRQPIALMSALTIAARVLADTIDKHGPDAIGFYLSGQLLTEDYAVFNKLARALVGTNNIDTNSRLCMSSAVSAYKLTLGADAPPACYEDLDCAETVFIAGSNTAFAHPVLFRRLEAAKARNPAMKIIVVDPRRTDTCAIADLHLPISAGTDVALFHAMLNVMVWEDLIDRDYIAQHTEGFDALKQRIHDFTPKSAEELCGVPAADIVQCARWFAQSKSTLSLYTMGLNQSSSGTAKNAALIHLHLATGQIGRPGAGPFSLTGQPNAMGGREAGGMATLLPGHRDPDNAAHRAEAAALWGVEQLPQTRGLTAVDMFDAVLAGKIKVLWIAGTNPAHSMPDQTKVRAALAKAEFVIVQEAFAHTETLAYADLVLPASTWPEKEGTVTNSERRISRVRAVIKPPGDAKSDWRLACAVAKKLAAKIAPAKAALFNYRDEAEIFAEHARFTAGRDLDYSALSYARLEAEGPQQWPYTSARTDSVRLYQDGIFPTASQRARFMDIGYTPVADPVSAQYPLRLTTGRLRDQWHTMNRSSLAPMLTRHEEEPRMYLHPVDMQRYRIGEDSLVKVTSRRGEFIAPARRDTGLKPGHAYIPMHWGSAFMAGDGVNALSHSVCDPISHQPELKHSAVGLEALNYPWQASAWIQGPSAALRQRLGKWLSAFPYAVVVPTAIGQEGVRLRLAGPATADAATLLALIDDLDLNQADLAFDDPARGVIRRIRRSGQGLGAFLLTGDTRAEAALLQWANDENAPDNVILVLMGRTKPPVRAAIICACENISEAAISQAIQAGKSLEEIQASLKCGTGCGSCVPQMRRMIQDHAAMELAA